MNEIKFDNVTVSGVKGRRAIRSDGIVVIAAGSAITDKDLEQMAKRSDLKELIEKGLKYRREWDQRKQALESKDSG